MSKIKVILTLNLITLLALSSLSTAAKVNNTYKVIYTRESTPMPNDHSPIEKLLTLSVKQNKVLALIIIKNISDRPVYIDEDALHVYPSLDGHNLDYIADMIKRRPKTIDEYIEIPPFQSIKLKYDLTQKYRFLSGKHDYEAHVIQGYWDPITKKEYPPQHIETITPFSYTHSN